VLNDVNIFTLIVDEFTSSGECGPTIGGEELPVIIYPGPYWLDPWS
jgi:hypothetical protein